MSIIRNLGSQWAATVYVGAISMLLTFLFGRFLGPEVFGNYNYLLTLGALVAIFQDGGFRTLIFRERTSPTFQRLKDKLVSIAIGHILVVTMAGMVLVVILPFSSWYLLILTIASFGLGTITAFYSAQIKGEGRFSDEARWRILVRHLTAGSILIFIFIFTPAIQWILIGGIVGYVVALALKPRECSLKPKFQKLDSSVYKSVTALLIIDVSTAIYFKIDIIMLRHLGNGLEEVGFYAASSRLMEGLVFFHLPFATVLFREMSLRADNSSQFISFIQKLLAWSCLPPLVIVPLGWVFSKEILSLCYGADFLIGAPILNLLLIAFFFMMPNLVLTQGALAVNLESYYAKIGCLTAAVNIGLNLLLIPSYGAQGAVIGTIATEAFLLISISWGVYIWCKRKR